jgi:hypothetical protein
MHPQTKPLTTSTPDVNATKGGRNGADVSMRPYPYGISQRPLTKSKIGCTPPQSSASCLSPRYHVKLRGCVREKSSPSSQRTPTS